MKTKSKNRSYFRVKKIPPARRFISLLILTGIFLLPNLARLSAITPGNIVKLTNEERAKDGLPELAENRLLAQAAYQKGLALIENKEFAHNLAGRRFSEWIRDTGYKYDYVGENLALDFYTAEGALGAWLDSPSHRRNILNDAFSEIGVAVLEGDLGGGKSTIVVQIFGAPATVQSLAPAPSLAPAETPAASIGSAGSGLLERVLRPVRQGALGLAFAYERLYGEQHGYFWLLNFWLVWLAALLLIGPDTLAKLKRQRYIIG